MREGNREEAVEEILRVIRVKVKVEEVRKIAGDRNKVGELIMVRFENEKNERKEVLEKKRLLKGRKERIMEDWTWRERKMRWKLKELARKEEGEGRKGWISYAKLRIDGQWWGWDEEEKVLRNGREEVKKGKRGKERDGKKDEVR